MKATLLMAFAVSAVIVSCGKKESVQVPTSESKIDQVTSGTVIEKMGMNGDWKIIERQSRDGDVYFKSESLPLEKANENARKEYKGTQMVEVSADPRFNVQLFRIEGKDTNNAVFIAPRIYAYSGNEANKMEPAINDEDGTMTLFFPIVFIDGLNNTIEAPNKDNGQIKVPANLLIQDKEGLVRFINKKYGDEFGEQNLAALSGCPKKIVITVAGREYDVASDILKQADYCQYNKPIYTSVKLPKKEALWLLQKGLYSGAAKISTIFETRVPYTVAKMSIEMNKSKLYEEIAARLKVNTRYAEVDLRTEITKIVRNQAMKISIQGNMNEHLTSIVGQAINEFFEKMPADPSKADMSCGSSPVCLKLSYTRQSYEENFSVNWIQTSDVLSGQNILTWTGLSSLSDDSVNFENLKNDNSKVATNLTLYDGSLIELKVSKIDYEKLSQNYKTTVAHNNVQIGTKEEERCIDHFLGGNGRGCHSREIPIYQDQWIETTILSVSKALDTIVNPTGKVDEILSNISFEIQWNENGKNISRICPANLFQRDADGRSILIRIENVPGCEVFSRNSANKPILSLINNSTVKSGEFKEGTITKNWKGDIVEDTKDYLYPLRSSFSGTVLRRGSSIRTDIDLKPGANIL